MKRIAFAGMVLTMTGCAALPGLVVRTAPETTRSDGSLAKFQEAETLYARMQWAEAQTAYVALTDEFPRNAFLWFRLGNCQTRLDKLEPAAQAYQNALSIEPQEGRYSYNLGLVRLAQARLAFDHAQHRLAGHEQIRRDAVEQAQRVEAALAPTPAGRP